MIKARLRFVSLICVLLVLLPGLRIEAHHSFGAEYDGNKPITLKGVVTKVDGPTRTVTFIWT